MEALAAYSWVDFNVIWVLLRAISLSFVFELGSRIFCVKMVRTEANIMYFSVEVSTTRSRSNLGKSTVRNWKIKLKSLLGADSSSSSVRSSRVSGGQSRAIPGESECTPVASGVEKFYRKQLQRNLEVFERFARQSRSRFILDVFASGASLGRHCLNGLVAELQENTKLNPDDGRACSFDDYYDVRILLALGDLLVTGANSDLDTQAGIQVFDFVRSCGGGTHLSRNNVLQYVEALGEVGRYEEQHARIDEFNLVDTAPLQVQLLGLDEIQHRGHSEGEWLDALNEMYSSIGMSRVQLLDDTSRPLLDRLISDNTDVVEGPKISVIMPTYSPGPGIHTALRSLLHQTWHNLEIIVVDDGSSVEYDDLFEKLEALDPRIYVIRRHVNAGAYAARNAGLENATGTFVTTHDDDDWSHPDKLALQAGFLVDDDLLSATTSAHVRTTENMHFRRINARAVHANKNYSSLMFRRDIITEIGMWDTVNRGGDSEFESRLVRHTGKRGKKDLVNFPAAFSRVWTGSLTSGEMTRGYRSYSRQLYSNAYLQWHAGKGKQNKTLRISEGLPRPYPVPTTFEPGCRNKDLGFFDVIYVADYFKHAKYLKAVLQEIEAAVKAGFSVGYMLLNSPQTPQRSEIAPRIFELQLAGQITQVSHDDSAEANLLIVYDPAIGMFLDTTQARVKVRRAITVKGDAPLLFGQESENATLMAQALDNLDRCFNTRFLAVSTTHIGRYELVAELPLTRVLDEKFVWSTCLPVGEPVGPVPPSGTPVVGFHTFANLYRWPSTIEDFQRVYVSNMHATKVFGHLKPAREKYNLDSFLQVGVMESSSSTVAEFLSGIDFWVYCPDDRLDDRTVWEPALIAMGAGKVVILPERLRGLYGMAALYADSNSIGSLVAEYSKDQCKFLTQARRGQDYVAEHHSPVSLVQRLKDLSEAS